MLALSRWLRRHRRDIDVACVSGFAHEAYAAIGVMERLGIPVVLRAEADTSIRQSAGQGGSRFARRVLARCGRATAVVTSSSSSRSELLDAGIERGRIHVIHDGVPEAVQRSAAGKIEARGALADVNHDLQTPLGGPVVVYAGPLESGRNLHILVHAWKHVVRERPDARLWFFGDGPLREKLYRQVRNSDLVGQVLLPGTVDALDDVYQAADALVWPAAGGGPALPLLEAMAAGLPVIAGESVEHGELLLEGAAGRLVASGNTQSWATAIIETLSDPAEAQSLAAAGMKRVRKRHSLSEMVAAHMQLFQELTAHSPEFGP